MEDHVHGLESHQSMPTRRGVKLLPQECVDSGHDVVVRRTIDGIMTQVAHNPKTSEAVLDIDMSLGDSGYFIWIDRIRPWIEQVHAYERGDLRPWEGDDAHAG